MRSLSPRHFDVSVDAVTLKNVILHSVATAFASSVLPVPGGPKSRTPFQGRRMPWKYPGMSMGSTTLQSTEEGAGQKERVCVGGRREEGAWALDAQPQQPRLPNPLTPH
jgi:hypothetical protein